MRKPSKAVAILKWKLKRGKEPTLENILAVLADTRRLIIPPELRRAPKPSFRLAPAVSIDDFEKNVLVEAIEQLQDEVRAVREAHEIELSEMVFDAYHNAREASAREPDNAELARTVAKMREILEKGLGGPIPPREDM